MTALDKQISMRLKIARKSFGWKTASAFCNSVGIPKSTYSQYEKGHRNPTAENIIKYGGLFEVDPGWLLTGFGHPFPCSNDSLARKKFIKDEIKKLQEKNILPVLEKFHVSMMDTCVTINMEIFCKILISIFEVLNNQKILCEPSEILVFCLDIYNDVEPLNITIAEKEKLIQLSINSMLKGHLAK